MEAINSSTTSESNINFGPVFIAIAAFTWTLDFVARNLVGQVMSSTMLVMFEHIILTILVSPVLWKSRHLIAQFNAKEWLALLIIGVGASALATVALTSGYQLGFAYAPAVALTQQLQPVIAIGLAHIFLKERLPKMYYPLSLLAISGVFLMYYPLVSALSLNTFDQLGITAAMYGLIAATLWGSGTVLGKYMLVHSDTEIKYFEMASFRFLIGMIALILFNTLTSFEISGQVDGDVVLGILFLALVPGLFALVLYYYGLKSTHASIATLFELAFPLSFVVLLPFLRNLYPITTIQFIGAGILVAATTYLSYRYGKQTDPDQFEVDNNQEKNPKELYPNN